MPEYRLVYVAGYTALTCVCIASRGPGIWMVLCLWFWLCNPTLLEACAVRLLSTPLGDNKDVSSESSISGRAIRLLKSKMEVIVRNKWHICCCLKSWSRYWKRYILWLSNKNSLPESELSFSRQHKFEDWNWNTKQCCKRNLTGLYICPLSVKTYAWNLIQSLSNLPQFTYS